MDNIYKELLEAKDFKKLSSFIKKAEKDLEKDPANVMAGIILAAGNYAIHKYKKAITKDLAATVMWNFIRHWLPDFATSPLRLLIYEDMLNPKFEEYFTSITPDIMEWLKERAKWNLENIKDAPDELKKHWQSVVDGNIPFGLKLKENEPKEVKE